MKIICVDNFARESVADSLVCENISEEIGRRIVDMLNLAEPSNTTNWYKLVPDDHRLHRGMTDLVSDDDDDEQPASTPLPNIEAEGERIVAETHKHESGMYLWTDVVGAVQTAIAEERARHIGQPEAKPEEPEHKASDYWGGAERGPIGHRGRNSLPKSHRAEGNNFVD